MNDKKKIVLYSILACVFMSIYLFLMFLKDHFINIEGILVFISSIFLVLAMFFGATAMMKHWILFWKDLKNK